jgi:hypothetical protein
VTQFSGSVVDMQSLGGTFYMITNGGPGGTFFRAPQSPVGTPSPQNPTALALTGSTFYVGTQAPPRVLAYDGPSGNLQGTINTGGTKVLALAADNTHIFWATDEPNHPLYSTCTPASCWSSAPDAGMILPGVQGPPSTSPASFVAPRTLVTTGVLPTAYAYWAGFPQDLMVANEANPLPLPPAYQAAPNGIISVAVDATGKHVYWIESVAAQWEVRGCSFPGVGPCGGTYVRLLPNPSPTPLTEIAVAGNYVFWTDFNARAIMRANALP